MRGRPRRGPAGTAAAARLPPAESPPTAMRLASTPSSSAAFSTDPGEGRPGSRRARPAPGARAQAGSRRTRRRAPERLARSAGRSASAVSRSPITQPPPWSQTSTPRPASADLGRACTPARGRRRRRPARRGRRRASTSSGCSIAASARNIAARPRAVSSRQRRRLRLRPWPSSSVFTCGCSGTVPPSRRPLGRRAAILAHARRPSPAVVEAPLHDAAGPAGDPPVLARGARRP